MPDLDTALTRLAALAEEATPGPWEWASDKGAPQYIQLYSRSAEFIAAADPTVVGAMTRSLRLLAEIRDELEDGHVTPESPDEDHPEPYCFE